jgi:HEAT repeats
MRYLLTALLFTVTLHAQNFTNATLARHSASRGVAAAVRGLGNVTAWVAWTTPVSARVTMCCSGWSDKTGFEKNCCSGCSLARSGNSFNITDKQHAGTKEMLIAAKLEAGVLQKVRLFDVECAVDAAGAMVHMLDGATPESAIDYLASEVSRARDEGTVVTAIAQTESPSMIGTLERLAGTAYNEDIREQAVFWIGQRGGERGFQFLRNLIRGKESTDLKRKAVFSMSQNEADGATDELISIARHHESTAVRREAVFWLGQKAGAKAAGELRRFVDEDPDEDVREHAVFAISQLPRERSVPLLIDLARNHKSRRVREKAIFWLTQTGDPRALDLIEEILTK